MIPSSWSDISTSQFIELQALKDAPYSSLIDRQMDTLLIVSDMTEDEVEDLSLPELNRLYKSLRWINKQPRKKRTELIGDMKVLPFRLITWGMFIDLEHFYTDGYVKNLQTILGIFLRQFKADEWNGIQYEPYNYNPVDRGELTDDIPITDTYGIITEYLDYRNNLIDVKYKHLFEKPPTDEEQVELTGQEKKEYEQAMEAEKRFNKWAYESITMQLASDDITKMNEVLDLPLVYVLNILSMKADLKEK